MLKLLRELDQFGVVFQPRIKYSRNQYKTYCGGIMSIMLYGLSLTYLVYLFFQWRTGQILPKISSMSVVEEQQQLTYEDTFIQVKFRQYANTTIDPFDEKAIVLQPLYYIFKNGVAQLQPYQPQYTIQQSSGKFNIMNISNLNIAISDIKNDDDADIEYMLTFGDCQKMLLKEGQQCANSTIVQEFYKQPTNTIIIKQFVQEFSSDTKSLQIIPREYLIPIQRNYTYYARTYVQITKTSVDAGILFEQWEFYSHITDYRFVSATVETSYISDVMRYNISLALFYTIDNIQEKQVIAYSKLSEILADAGSIASTILLLSYIIIRLNQSQLQFETVNKVISMYYPDFKHIKIRRNLFGRISQVDKGGKLIDLASFKETYERLSKIGEIKLTISNQIYEISRMQFLMQSFIAKQQIQQIHKRGLPLNINYAEAQNDENQSVDMSMVQELRFKRNTILPTNERGTMMLESKSNVNSKDATPQVFGESIYADNDFEMFLQPDEVTQKESKAKNIQELMVVQD